MSPRMGVALAAGFEISESDVSAVEILAAGQDSQHDKSLRRWFCNLELCFSEILPMCRKCPKLLMMSRCS